MNVSRILVIRFGRLGDLVLAAAATRELGRAYPGCAIDMAVRDSFAETARLLPGVTRIVPIAPGGPARLLALRAAGLADRYDLVIDLQGNLKSRLLSFLAGGARTVSYPRLTLRRRMLVWGKGRAGGEEPVWRRYLRAVERTGVRVAHDPPRIRRVEAAGIPGAIAFAPGAGRETKRWPEEHFTAAVRRAARFDRPLLLLGSAGEKGMLERIRAVSGADAKLFAGEPIDRTAALLRDAAVLVTNDSGLLHLAEASGTPVIALFGPTVSAFGFAPSHPSSILFERDLSCRPCTLHGGDLCPIARRNHECLRGIEPDPVVTAIGRFVVCS